MTSKPRWFWEICALVIGYLGPTPLAAHVAAINLVSLIACNTRSLGKKTNLKSVLKEEEANEAFIKAVFSDKCWICLVEAYYSGLLFTINRRFTNLKGYALLRIFFCTYFGVSFLPSNK